MLSDEERNKFERLALEFWRGVDRGAPGMTELSKLSAYVESLLAQARAEEREACAKVADDWASGSHTASGIAAAIRARKDDHESD